MDNGVLSLPYVGPSHGTLERFWRRVAEVTTRHHDDHREWVGGEDVRRWNESNKQPCERCANSKNNRECIVDESHPSCRPCRRNKVGCDRKPRFVFDMTKEQFFPSYSQFMRIYQDGKSEQIRRLRRQEYRYKPYQRPVDHRLRIKRPPTSSKEFSLINRPGFIGYPPSGSESESASSFGESDLDRMRIALDTVYSDMRTLRDTIQRTVLEQNSLAERYSRSWLLHWHTRKALAVAKHCIRSSCTCDSNVGDVNIGRESKRWVEKKIDDTDLMLARFMRDPQIVPR
ncbi:hypothetical protein DFH06DRAFT_1145605 [Mycena polygramma]|nr:hypothetical protein DFH06DRAFT_1145605 [Mycena polygramma]